MQIPWDEVQCEIRAERDIVSDTVRVVVQASLTLAGQDSAKVRATLSDVLTSVLDGKWQFSSIDRDEDKSGMEQVVTVASARVKEHLTGGLVERLTKVSKPGLRLSLRDIITRPPRSDIDKARVDARRDIYEAAQREAELLNQVYANAPSGLSWRVGGIRIDEVLVEPARSRRAMAMMARTRYSSSVADHMEDDSSPDIAVSTRLTLKGTVKLKRPSVEPPEGGFFVRN